MSRNRLAFLRISLIALLIFTGCGSAFASLPGVFSLVLLLVFFALSSACYFHPITGASSRNSENGSALEPLALLALLLPGAAAADVAGDAGSDIGTSVCTGTQDYTQSFNFSTGLDPAAAGIGYKIIGAPANSSFGYKVTGAGDFNGDGIGDVVLWSYISGAAGLYVIFGRSGSSGTDVDVGTLSTADGIVITGSYYLGTYANAVSGVGDVNGDGFDDVAAGDFSDNTYSGSAWVIFGSASPGDVDVSSFTAAEAVRFFTSAGTFYYAGSAVSGPGDVNGDGIDDLLVGSHGGPSGNRGIVHVVYGKSGGFGGSTVDLTTINGGADGYYIDGESAFDRTGRSLGPAGDVNQDGVQDFLIGSHLVDVNGGAYVITGVAGTRSNILMNADGGVTTHGFKISGVSDSWANTLSGGGQDFNGDGVSDFAVSADTYGGSSGRTALLFGEMGNLSLGTPAAGQGILLDGSGGERAGRSFSLAGDVNGDGLADLLVGGPNAGNNGYALSGSAHLIFGRADWPNTGALLSSYTNGTDGIRLDGAGAGGTFARGTALSDVNGDGCADMLIGEPGNGNGSVYVIYGGLAQ